MKARELMEALTAKSEKEEGIKPKIEKRIEGQAPPKPNVFSDGSLKNTKGHFWQLGGGQAFGGQRETSIALLRRRKGLRSAWNTKMGQCYGVHSTLA